MGFPSYPFPRKERSFVGHVEVLAYYQSFCDRFNLNRIIKFRQQVTNVRPLPDDRWEVKSVSFLEPECLNGSNLLNFSTRHRF